MFNAVGIAFLIIISLNLILESALDALNLGHLKKKARQLPAIFKARIDQETYEKSISYNFDYGRFDIVANVVSFVFIITLVYFGGFIWIDNLARNVDPHGRYLAALLFALSVGVIKLLIDLPLSIYSTFIIEKRHGFSTTTPGIFLVDLLKSVMLSALIGIPLYLGILWFMEAAGRYWWIWCWFFLEAAQLFLLIIYPAWIAPLFNKFTPIEDGELKDAIIALARQVGFPNQGIFVMDGSKRSRHSNAFFTGLGKKKRIVLLDTLMRQMNHAHILAVLAHELGHYRLRHVKKMLVLNSSLLFFSLYLLSRLFGLESFYHGFGFRQPSNYAALISFSISLSAISFFLTPLFSLLSRQFEYQADEFAIENTEHLQVLPEVIAILARENLMNLNPHPWYAFFHYTHPTPVERVQSIERFFSKKNESNRMRR